MQQITTLYIHCHSDNEWERIVKSVKDYLFGLSEDDKPEYYDSWLEGLHFNSAEHKITVDSDVHAPFCDYDILLHELIENIATNNSNANLTGFYNFYHDDYGEEEHGFTIENGRIIWDSSDDHDLEEACDDDFDYREDEIPIEKSNDVFSEENEKREKDISCSVTKNIKTIKPLTTISDSQAHVEIDNNNNIYLISHQSLVAGIKSDGTCFCNGPYSKDTRKHISAFAREYATPLTDRSFKLMYDEKLCINYLTGEFTFPQKK